MSEIDEIQRRRTFAIISHPDAGKTTLTEKFLLYGGAVNMAGAVRSRKTERATTSDWMELEKQRGISVSSTVLQFEYENCVINLLDTPGHKDFSEDTYRVLTAVDAAIMVLDAAAGIEEQTLKLFKVCRQRGVPIFTFINKCDRPGKSPLELLDEIEETLDLKAYAATWPIGSGPFFEGVFDRMHDKLHLFQRSSGGQKRAPVLTGSLEDPELAARLPEDIRQTAVDELGLLDLAGQEFSPEAVYRGELTPVFFGSAIHNFGVQLLLESFLHYGPPPQSRSVDGRELHPRDEKFSAFIFKIQANMDPKHRDRLAFMRICSGRFQRDMQVTHAQTGKKVRLSFAHQLFGQGRETVNEGWAGDVVGVSGHSDFGIGDTLTEDDTVKFDPIPAFAPETFVFLTNSDTTNFKRFRRGLEQLLQEKVVQRFSLHSGVRASPLLGAVGTLQFDVVQARLLAEYNAPTRLEPARWTVARWLDPELSIEDLEKWDGRDFSLARDDEGRFVALFDSKWSHSYFERQNPEVALHTTPPLNNSPVTA